MTEPEGLDDINSGSVRLWTLRQTLREWHAVAKDPSLPPGVHYLLNTDSEIPVIEVKRTRNTLVVDCLREIAHDEDLEIFLSVLEFGGPGDDTRLMHMMDFNGNNLHEYFVSDKQELLQDYIAFSQSEDHIGTSLPPTQTRAYCVTILPTCKILHKENVKPGPTEDDNIRLREIMMCYLTDRVLDKVDVAKANYVLQAYYWRPAELDEGNPTPFQWPRKALEKHLLNAMTVATRAAAISYEPPPRFFEYFADKPICFPPRVLEDEDSEIIHGLDILLTQVDLPNLPPVLSHFPPLVHGDLDAHDPTYIGRWLHRVSWSSRYGPGVYFRMEYATLIVDISIPMTVSKIQYLLDGAPGQAWETASRVFLQWIEDQFYDEGIRDGKSLTVFWLPLIRDLTQRHDASFWEPEPSLRREMHRDVIRAVLISYLKVCVGAEPRRLDFCRPSLVTPECRGCSSCKVVNRFLLDISRVRAIFPVTRPAPPGTFPRDTSPGYVLQHSALAHILPGLATKKINCSFHVKERTCAGTVLCVEKRDGGEQWVDWCARREEAAGEMAKFDAEKMVLVLGRKDYNSLIGMEILKRANKADWIRMIETYVEDAETQRTTDPSVWT
ncbi:hypothetical protein SLS53_007527 [Cytospora paraplurivora]|uniref:Uncharacterized protein n=1 Tax=Cytospora paraplurivora TaxID=2898453 RepID=A0AAN9TZV2_9PEZI